MAQYLLALDAGTTSSRSIVFDKQGNIISVAQKEFPQYFPKEGWVEHDAMEIWATQSGVMVEAVTKAGLTAKDIAAVGITNQRETTVVWDKNTGKPVCHAIVWQCRRTADYIEELEAKGFDKVILQKTGLIADPYFSGTKIRWILQNVPGAKEKAEKGDLLFGNIDTWLIWNLTKGKVFATDYSNASRTMLFNIHTLKWDPDLCKEMGIPMCMLPDARPSSGDFGETEIIEGGKIKITGVAGDQQSALFGQCCYKPGMVKNTYGTGCFTLMNTGTKAVESKNKLLTTIAWGNKDGSVEYALEGSVFVAGATLQWIRDGLRMIDNAAFTEAYATKVPDTGGVYMVPAFTGLGAPYWDPYARGTIVGLTRGTTKEHFIRAALESLAYQSNDVIVAMKKDAGVNDLELRVDGGASANNFLMQFQSDISNCNVVRPKVVETTAQGAVYLAGLAVGYYKDKNDILSNVAVDRTFKPSIDAGKRAKLVAGWDKAVQKSLGWAKED